MFKIELEKEYPIKESSLGKNYRVNTVLGKNLTYEQIELVYADYIDKNKSSLTHTISNDKHIVPIKPYCQIKSIEFEFLFRILNDKLIEENCSEDTISFLETLFLINNKLKEKPPRVFSVDLYSPREQQLQQRINELEVDNAALSKAYADILSKHEKLIEQANQFIDFFQNFNNPKES